MRKLFLAFVMALLCNVVSFAQIAPTQPQGSGTTPQDPYLISTASEFLWISNDNDAYYKQTEDINLSDLGQKSATIISSFSGTYDGDGHSITYQASFTADNEEDKLALFGTVTGKIQKLRISKSTITSSGTNTAQIALLCANLSGNNGRITDCEIFNGNINSTISTTGNYERVATGLLVGLLSDGARVEYCSATGNVVGYGYVGGLVGQASNGHVLGSSFVGSVEAAYEGNPNWNLQDYFAGAFGTGRGSYAGGIIGYANNSSSINLCYVKADVVSEELGIQGYFDYYSLFACTGVGATNNDSFFGSTGKPRVTNCYAEGTVNGDPINTTADLTNSANTNNGNNYYEGAIIQGCSTQQSSAEDKAECIANKLNTAVSNSSAVPNEDKDKIHFSVSDDGNVIFGVVSTESVCETPTNLTITKNDDGTYTASWEVVAVDEEAPIEFVWTLKREEEVLNVEWSDPVLEQNVWSISTESSLDASLNAYTFYVKSKCSEDLFSEEVSIPFYVDCPTPTALTASNITDNGFKISWTADVECQVSLYDNEEILVGNKEIILSNQDKIKLFEGLNPETQYTVTVKAKCGDEYVEQATTNVTTACLAAPTGLAVNTVWNGSGTATITWDMVDGLTYEIEGQTGNKESGFAITGLAENNYTLRLRAKKGTKTSDWVSMPYTISSPDAPKNPQVEYTRNGNKYDVTVSWTAGSTPNNGWIVNGGEVQNTASYVLYNQLPGTEMTLSIVEKVDLSTSRALQVPIQVPCLPATLPNAVSTTQTSATFTFSQAIANRKVIIGSNEYPASATSITIDGLTSGTTYSYEVREYCNGTNGTQYSSVFENFATVGCFAVKNLSVSNIGVTNATISWGSQSTLADLNYQITINGELKPEQTDTTITLTGLTSATEYNVVVKEQCGEGWGEGRTISFTTMSSDFETIADGEFNNSATWKNGNVPTGDIGTITINHIVSLNNTLILKNSCKIINKGVLIISQLGELINTTDNNVGGIIEIVSPTKTMNQWTFIGAPFADDYTLGCIIPNTNDIGVVRFNYEGGVWKSDWERTSSKMKAGEGYFAWPFYAGVVTYTTYGDVGEFNATTNTWYKGEYDFTKQPDTWLNNADFQFKRDIPTTGTDHWMALSNPYPAKLSAKKFVDKNDPVGDPEIIQGRCVYVFRNGTFDIDANHLSTGDINMTEGFFVNFKNGGNDKSVTFEKSQLTNYPPSSSKSTNASSEFIELTLQNGKDKVRVYFAHNQDAEQGYDIFDANKMFATTGVAEPYFVTDGIALIKEEVAELPYYATMNVRSQEDTVMNFVLTNLPEGYAVSIIDGEEVIDLVEGGVYSTEIASGENADRFKVLVKKNVGLADVEELDVRITNSNRHISIMAQENVRTEVYNTLGQKVFETEETNFVLSGVASGAYVVKVQGAKASKSQKIVVE